jgi:hypothetical protein
MQTTSTETCVVSICWVSPAGRPAPLDRCFSLAEEVWNDAPYFKFDNSNGSEEFFFRKPDDAIAFKKKVNDFYQRVPFYCVIDDSGKQVMDESGNPIVAWIPDVEICHVACNE